VALVIVVYFIDLCLQVRNITISDIGIILNYKSHSEYKFTRHVI